MTRGWHILREDAGVTVARHLPVRFDVQAATTLAACDAQRLASQIRQDIWRALQDVRGFSPVVRVTPEGAQMHVVAGGRTMVPNCTQHAQALQRVLDNHKNRARWVRCAGGAA